MKVAWAAGGLGFKHRPGAPGWTMSAWRGQGTLLLGKLSLTAPPAPGEREVGEERTI